MTMQPKHRRQKTTPLSPAAPWPTAYLPGVAFTPPMATRIRPLSPPEGKSRQTVPPSHMRPEPEIPTIPAIIPHPRGNWQTTAKVAKIFTILTVYRKPATCQDGTVDLLGWSGDYVHLDRRRQHIHPPNCPAKASASPEGTGQDKMFPRQSGRIFPLGAIGACEHLDNPLVA